MAAAPAEPAPAGFWARYVAWSLDAACLLPLGALLCAATINRALADARAAMQALVTELPRLLGDALDAPQSPLGLALRMLSDPALHAAIAGLEAAITTLVITPLLVYVLLALPWSVGFEQSSWRATPGKRALGLVVVDARGQRLKAGHALQRFLAAGLSWLTLNLGHALAMLPPRHLALHDRISATHVVRTTAAAQLPAWAKAWLLAQVLATLAACGWAFLWLQAAMQAALQQALGPL